MSRLLQFIITEHTHIRERTRDLYREALRSGIWKPLLEYCEHAIEQNHHQKEEEFLFAAVAGVPELRSGGPQCTYYFEFHMSQPALKSAVALSKKVLGQELIPHWTDKMKEFRAQNLPLIIPCEDHEAGRLLLRLARALINEKNSDPAKMQEIFSSYLELQNDHFKKEETCLFVMCSQLLSDADWDPILKKMRLAHPDL